jgi:hypothetical protein
VLRFVVRAADGLAVPVEMRGHEVRGVLTEGDRVAVGGYETGTTLRPPAIDNLTTSSPVEVWTPSGLRRLLGHAELRTAALSAVVTSGIGIAVGWLHSDAAAPGSNGGGTPVTPAPGGSGDDGWGGWWLALGGVLLVAALLVLVLLLRRRRGVRGRQLAAALVGVAAGVLLALVLFV